MYKYVTFFSLLFLVSCSNSIKHYYSAPPKSILSQTYQQRYPISVKQKEYVLDIPISLSIDILSDKDLQKAISFAGNFAKSKNNMGGNLSIMIPTGAKNYHQAIKIGNELVEKLSGIGGVVSRQHLRLITYDAKKHKKSPPIRLSYYGFVAKTKKCGNWNDLSDTSHNNNSLNFGCATQHNLAAMLQNPQDLKTPRATTDIDAARRANVIDDYRQAQEPNTPDDSYRAINRVEF